MFRPAGLSESDDDEELELESCVRQPESTKRRPMEEHLDMTPTRQRNEEEPHDSGFYNGDHSTQNDGYGTEIRGTDTSPLNNGLTAEKLESLKCEYSSHLSPHDYSGYMKGYMKASSPTPSWSSRKSRSPVPSGSWRVRHHESSLPFDEFRMAAMHGNLPAIKDILKKGVAVDQILKSGWTCLMYACSCGKTQVVKYLLQQNANPNLHKELFTALMAACASSKESEPDLLETVDLLLSYGAIADAAERHRMTPLMFASKEGRSTIVQRLIDAKVDINKQDNKGWSALCWAATKGHGQVVRILLQNHADAQKINSHGQRAADIALAAGYPEIADILERVAAGGGIGKGVSQAILTDLPESTCSKPLKEKTCGKVYGELEMVLTGLDLSYMIPLFQEHQVSFETFLRLTEKDLENMNVTAVGVRKKILHAIKEIHKKEWQISSLPNLTLDATITVPEAVAMVTNINKHIRYIHATIGYLRDQLQNNPRLLQLGQEVHSVSSLATQCGDSLKYTKALHEELKFFKIHLDKVSGNAEYTPADVIVDCVDNGQVWRRRILTSLITTTAIATVLWFSRPRTFARMFNISLLPQDTVTLDI